MVRWLAALALMAGVQPVPLTVRVLDEAGQPLAGVHVTLHRHAETGVVVFGDDPPPGETDAKGSFETQVLPGSWNVLLHGPIVPQELRTQKLDADMRVLEVRADRGVALSGRVLYSDGTAAPAKTAVSIDDTSPPQMTATGERGAFTFAHVTRGKVVLRAQLGGLFAIGSAPTEAKAP